MIGAQHPRDIDRGDLVCDVRYREQRNHLVPRALRRRGGGKSHPRQRPAALAGRSPLGREVSDGDGAAGALIASWAGWRKLGCGASAARSAGEQRKGCMIAAAAESGASEGGFPMYAAIRQGKAKAGMAEELTRRIKEGAIPIISDVEGFMAYYVVYAPDDTVTAISIFNNFAGAEESNRRGVAWIEQNLTPLLVGPATAVAGPVIVHTLA
jgi:hypothetical protein